MPEPRWKVERGGKSTYGLQSRKLKPPPATPWGKLELEWRMKVGVGHPWQGSLKEVLKAAVSGMREANKRSRKAGRGSRWESVEAFLQGWARARRWLMDLDPVQDLLTIRPDPGKQPPRQKPPRTDFTQPSLFDLD